MRKLIKIIFCLAIALPLPLQRAQAHSLAGNVGNGADTWQIADLGYGWLDQVAPKNINEGYRHVVPVVYYTIGRTFRNAFGVEAEANIDHAFGVVNGAMCGLTNTPVFLFTPTNGIVLGVKGARVGPTITVNPNAGLDSYAPDMSDFTLEAQNINYTAQTLGIWDMKSILMHAIVGHLGLANPDRYVWALKGRYLTNPNGICPRDIQYVVLMRNFDMSSPSNYIYSPYINNILYTYRIQENCDAPAPWRALAISSPADPFAASSTAVASGAVLSGSVQFGRFYVGLSRDDATGLRHLLSTNKYNYHYEATAPSGVSVVSTNLGPVAPMTTLDLGALIADSRTNDPAALMAKYPGLVAYALATNWANVYATNVLTYYTNAGLGSPYPPPPPTLVTVTNVTLIGWIPTYTTVFANIKTNHYYSTTTTTIVTTTVTNMIGAPYPPALVTNTVTKTVVLTNTPSGDYYLVADPNAPAGTNSLPLGYVPYPGSGTITNIIITTNVISMSSTLTNVTTNTTSTATNLYAYDQTQMILTYTTNYTRLMQAQTLVTSDPVPAMRRGMGRVQFIRVSYDDILEQTFQPVVSRYSMTYLNPTNGTEITETCQRVITQPDFLVQASDLSGNGDPGGSAFTVSAPTFDTSTVLPNSAGPGTIVPGGVVFTFNSAANNAYFLNGSPNQINLPGNEFLTSSTQTTAPMWGQFDGTTNYPAVYPVEGSIVGIIDRMVYQITPAAMPDGTLGAPYTATIAASGGLPPYVWSVAPSTALPPGLSFNPATQVLSGTPTMRGTFNFSFQLTDSVNRTVTFTCPVKIN